MVVKVIKKGVIKNKIILNAKYSRRCLRHTH